MLKILSNLPPVDGMCQASDALDNKFLVYKLSADGEGYELYDYGDIKEMSVNDYADDDCIAVPLRSTSCSRQTYRRNAIFRNISGSNCDHKINSKNWLQLMKDYHCPTDDCCTDGYFYADGYHSEKYREVDGKLCKSSTGELLTCSGIMVGGHVLFGHNVSPAEGSTVDMICICNKHNIENVSGRTGQGFYMKLAADCYGLRLEGYLRKAMVRDMIAANAALSEAAASGVTDIGEDEG